MRSLRNQIEIGQLASTEKIKNDKLLNEPMLIDKMHEEYHPQNYEDDDEKQDVLPLKQVKHFKSNNPKLETCNCGTYYQLFENGPTSLSDLLTQNEKVYLRFYSLENKIILGDPLL